VTIQCAVRQELLGDLKKPEQQLCLFVRGCGNDSWDDAKKKILWHMRPPFPGAPEICSISMVGCLQVVCYVQEASAWNTGIAVFLAH
jgi:hypothetical protein